MKNKFLLIFILTSSILSAQNIKYTASNAHSHNDYEQATPFWTAYHQEFGSIEADVFLQNDSILVSHDRIGLTLRRTLENLYLKQIDSCINNNNGFPYADHSKKLQLLIDIKSNANTTLEKLIAILNNYPKIIQNKNVIFTISGNRPADFTKFPSFIHFDGSLTLNYSSEQLKKISLLSDNIINYVKGASITEEELKNLEIIITKAHSLKKPVRFWGTPDNQQTWRILSKLNIDFINTDHIDALSAFFKGDTLPVIGELLPKWKAGYLDLHHINTGRGNATFFLLPDSTSMIVDAGEEDITEPRTLSLRNSTIHPNDSKHPYEWICSYIYNAYPAPIKQIDYALISHFHEDHFGGWYKGAPKSINGSYILSGITGVGDLIPIKHLIDRGYPTYDIPVSYDFFMEKKKARETNYFNTMQNYRSFVNTQVSMGMVAERLKAGATSQIVLLHSPKLYPNFFIRGVKVNGEIWNGKDSSFFQHFPALDTTNMKTWPDENSLSLALTIHYGPFIYYTGGDCPGIVFLGDPAWRDVETPVAKAVGQIDVATMDHHGNRDAVNEFQIQTFQPTAWIEQVWSSDHPGHEVLIRLTSKEINKSPKDLFATNMLDANKLVIGPLIENSYKSLQGHILVRVLPGGNDYYIYILDDNSAELRVKNIYGPYRSKSKF